LAKPVAFIEEEARKLRLRFSEGWRNLGRATNKVIAWPKFCERLGTPTIDTLTSEQYHKLSQKDRHERKNQGWFVGGTFKDGIRRQSNIEGRSMLCYDIDECSPELFASLTADVATGYLAEREHFVYTTRSHTPENPRVRVVVPLSREITTGEFGPICRIVAFKIDESMQQIDPVSFRITQLMFLPSRSKDGEFITNWRHGALLNPDDVLKDWARDYDRTTRACRARRARRASCASTASKWATPGKNAGSSGRGAGRIASPNCLRSSGRIYTSRETPR
jgi:putative DNA primase/helicase